MFSNLVPTFGSHLLSWLAENVLLADTLISTGFLLCLPVYVLATIDRNCIIRWDRSPYLLTFICLFCLLRHDGHLLILILAYFTLSLSYSSFAIYLKEFSVNFIICLMCHFLVAGISWQLFPIFCWDKFHCTMRV
jgi:hypothetical protein